MSVLIYKEKKKTVKKRTRILKAKDQKNITSISLCPWKIMNDIKHDKTA